jgi:Flp pilus assembly protein CpaB
LVNMQEAITTARQRRPFTILGMLIALITLAAFIFLALNRPGSGGSPIPLTGDVSVVVAKVDIPSRATITAEQLTIAKLNANDVPPSSFHAIADVAGKTARFALIDIKAGQPVLANAIVTSADPTPPVPSFLAIPQGFVAMTIPTSEEQGVAGYIQPGDYIGIIATVDKSGTTTSKTIFNNVHVLQVGTATVNIANGRNGPTSNRVAGAAASSLTIVVNQCDAEYLTWFLAKTNLRYTLEMYSDYNKGTANNPQQAADCPIDKAGGVTNADVAKRFGATLVP